MHTLHKSSVLQQAVVGGRRGGVVVPQALAGTPACRLGGGRLPKLPPQVLTGTQQPLQHQARPMASPVAAAASGGAAAAAAEDNAVYIPISELRELCTKSLSTLGYSSDETAVLLDVSISAAGLLFPPSYCGPPQP
jgi:hypothetical protein